MVIENFKDTWYNFVEWCKANSDKFGLTESDIYAAHPLVNFSPQAPFLAIFALPDDDDDNMVNNSAVGRVRFTLFVAGPADPELSEAVIGSTMLACKIRNIILQGYTKVSKNENSKPTPESMYSDSCIISFELSSYYKV